MEKDDKAEAEKLALDPTLYGENTRISKHSMAVLSNTNDSGSSAPFLRYPKNAKRQWNAANQSLVSILTLPVPTFVQETSLLAGSSDYSIISSKGDPAVLRVNEIEEVVTGNRIWKGRTIGMGRVSAQEGMDYAFSCIVAWKRTSLGGVGHV